MHGRLQSIKGKKMKQIIILISILLAGCSHPFVAIPQGNDNPQNAAEWYQQGEAQIAQNRASAKAADSIASQQAKNIILFIGDGMGISTVTAARILAGQQQGNTGEENSLFFETFPHLALSKTYNTNQQTPDSAGTMSAIMTGVKTKAGLISVNQQVVRGDCQSQTGNDMRTALEYAEMIGLSTGIVSTARVTHATPAATYAHSMDREFENDSDASQFADTKGCDDIASQLIGMPQRFKNSAPQVDGLEVVLVGGRRNFLCGEQGSRQDGRNLTQEWLADYQDAAYISDKAALEAVDLTTTKHLLGLFSNSHMDYETDRQAQPSLTEMTQTAISLLQQNKQGFFLMVEAGRIDHAHHATNPYRALEDTIELAKAVEAAYNHTNPEETLIIVTADHSHVFTLGGYPTRGNPILGKVISNDAAGNPESTPALAEDGMPYTTIGYANGRGFQTLPEENSADAIYAEEITAGRVDLTEVDTSDPNFHPAVLVPQSIETHGAEDVAIYATGPGASLINGVMEQHSIFHVMNEAGRLAERARKEMEFESLK